MVLYEAVDGVGDGKGQFGLYGVGDGKGQFG